MVLNIRGKTTVVSLFSTGAGSSKPLWCIPMKNFLIGDATFLSSTEFISVELEEWGIIWLYGSFSGKLVNVTFLSTTWVELWSCYKRLYTYGRSWPRPNAVLCEKPETVQTLIIRDFILGLFFSCFWFFPVFFPPGFSP